MEFQALFGMLRRRWWLILLPTLVAGALSVTSLRTMISPPVSYTLAIKFTASAKPTNGGTFQDQSYTPWLASEYAVNGIAAWMRTESFAKEVAASLDKAGKSIAVPALRSVVVSDSARSLMTFYVTNWLDLEEIKAIGNAAIDVLANRTDAYFPQLAGEKTVIVPLDEVSPSLVAPPITQRFAPLVRIAVGFGLGLLFAFAVEYFDRTIRDRTELESLGLSVIVEIPRH